MRRSSHRNRPAASALGRRTATLLAPLAVLALGLGASAPNAAAKACKGTVYGEFCETAREHAEFEAFTACPFGAAPDLVCSEAQST
jgi:hypothetical protein